MLHPNIHARRRQVLSTRVTGPILLMGNGHRARNLPMTPLPFRQDSTFLYYTGCDLPGAAALLLEGRCILFLPEPAPDDPLWHGEVPSLEALREHYGADEVRPATTLEEAVPEGPVRVLAVADENRNRFAARLCGVPLAFGSEPGDPALVDAVIAMRRAKQDEEIAEIRLAAEHSAAAHVAVMRATHPGRSERALAALFDAVLAARGCVPGYGTILSQSGEVLHNERHDQVLSAGRLLLLDGGGEVATGYGADITRTWPVDGRFRPRQRAAYEAVLAALETAIPLCRAGVRYREVHDAASRVIARWLRDEGLITVDPDTSVETGAHGVFFPHGVGHLLGMDVHDLENFGDRPAYPPDRGRPEQFGTRYLRLDLPLEPGWVVTIEPGFYVVPAILADPGLRETLAGQVDFERAQEWIGFGGIRIEDNVLVTTKDPDVLTEVPKTPGDVEALVGTGVPAEDLLASA